MESFEELFVERLRDVYSAEQQLVKALPKIIKGVKTPVLRQAIENHLYQTKGQIERLDRIFEELGEKSSGETCKGMEGLLKEGDELLKEKGDDSLRDAALIDACQHVEHYEIASYGTLVTFARDLGYMEIATLLQETLREEKETDQLLTRLAEGEVNPEAEDVMPRSSEHRI